MKKYLPLLVGFAVAVVASFGVCRWGHCKTNQSMDALQDAAWLKKTLQLSDPQVAEIQKLQTDLKSRMQQCDTAHCAARCQLAGVLFSVDKAKADAQIETMCKMQADVERATLEHIRQVHALLTPEQKKQYENLISSCVCAQCSHDVH
jgi:hypothetical protein